MSYNEFLEQIVYLVKEQLGKKAEIENISYLKENGVSKTGILIRYEGSNVSPAIYLEEFYQKHLSGVTLNKIAREIIRISRIEIPFDESLTEDISSYQNIRYSILPKLINTSMNRELLKDIPHVDVLDLSIVFYIVISEENNSLVSTLVKNNLISLWNVSVDDLLKQSFENVSAAAPSTCESLLTTIMDKCDYPDGFAINVFEEQYPLYILTNQTGCYGAICMFEKSALKNFADSVEDDLIIIPSSVHEVLLVPMSIAPSISEFNDMIKEVNEEAVQQIELLSNHAYIYRREIDSICIPEKEIDAICVETLLS